MESRLNVHVRMLIRLQSKLVQSFEEIFLQLIFLKNYFIYFLVFFNEQTVTKTFKQQKINLKNLNTYTISEMIHSTFLQFLNLNNKLKNLQYKLRLAKGHSYADTRKNQTYNNNHHNLFFFLFFINFFLHKRTFI